MIDIMHPRMSDRFGRIDGRGKGKIETRQSGADTTRRTYQIRNYVDLLVDRALEMVLRALITPCAKLSENSTGQEPADLQSACGSPAICLRVTAAAIHRYSVRLIDIRHRHALTHDK
ncbi:hypothetical protein ACGFOU_27170 [Streptomyces sp. NPDC048595]|uniref:hypothetical protein n=1 Tax=Streptomyces sp. NPDC048595 TaxID=3365576 RepID=UPI00371D1CEC